MAEVCQASSLDWKHVADIVCIRDVLQTAGRSKRVRPIWVYFSGEVDFKDPRFSHGIRQKFVRLFYNQAGARPY
jgi:hypothetical protein